MLGAFRVAFIFNNRHSVKLEEAIIQHSQECKDPRPHCFSDF